MAVKLRLHRMGKKTSSLRSTPGLDASGSLRGCCRIFTDLEKSSEINNED